MTTNEIKSPLKKSTYNMRNAIVNYYLFLMFAVFELILTSQYEHARNDKYISYVILTSILVVSVGGISLSYTADKNAPIQDRVVEAKPFFSMSITDISFIVFFVGAVISTLISDYKLDSLTGSAGRDNGLILLSLYFCMYFIISRFFYYKEYVLSAFLVGGCIVAGLAVLNYFYIDPLGIFNNYGDDVINDFGSTIGNKNTIASFMCIFLPVGVMMFTVYKKRYIKILSAVSIGFAYTGMLVADSNSGYIGLIVVLFFMLIICVRDPYRLKSYMLALVIMFASGKLLRLFSFIMNDKVKEFEAIALFLIYDVRSYLIIAFCAVCYGVMVFITKGNGGIIRWPKGILTAVVAVTAIAIAGVCGYVFIYYTFIDTATNIGSLSHLFRFDDRWGTHRGFMWINGIRDYLGFDFMHILFGSGCDTFYHVFSPHFDELLQRFGNSSTDCIHSEYLNYLVTQGIVGLVSYIGIVASAVVRAIKKSKDNLLLLVFAAPVVCYSVQAVVNIYQPITTPFLFIFVALCECAARGSNKANKLSESNR